MIVMPPVFNAGDTIYFFFETYGSSGESITMSGLAVADIEVYKNGSTTQRSSDNGYTLLDTDGIDFDGTTGLHGFSIDTSDNTDAGFWVDGGQYLVNVNAVTVNSQTVRFSYLLTLGYLLRPTTAGRKLDVSSGGEAGLDWANVGSPTTTVGLSGTTVKTATDVETDTADIQSRLPAALGANGNIKADLRDYNGTAGTFSGGRPEVKLGNVAHQGTSFTLGGAFTISEGGFAITNTTGAGIDVTAAQQGFRINADTSNGGYNALELLSALGGSIYAPDQILGDLSGDVLGEVASIGAGGIVAASIGADAFTAAKFAANCFTTAKFSGVFPTNFPSTVISAGGIVSADMTAISADSTAADNAESFFDGTGYAGTGNVIPTVTLVTTTTTLTNKTGFSLAATGLDSITATAPATVASTFPEMVVQLWRRFFKKSTMTSTELKTYADNGSTVVTTQTVSDDGTTQTQGAAS